MDVGQNDSVVGRVIQYIGILSPNRFVPFPPNPSDPAAYSGPLCLHHCESGMSEKKRQEKKACNYNHAKLTVATLRAFIVSSMLMQKR